MLIISVIRKYSRDIYLWTLLVLAVSLPLSPFMVSVSQFVLVINWIIAGNFKTKLNRLKSNKALIIFLSLYLLHVIGMFYSEEIGYGLKDLKIKLPLLIITFIVGTSDKIPEDFLRKSLRLFMWGVFIGSVFSFALYLGFAGYEYSDVRDISIIISHIRFSLYMVLSVFILIYDYLTDNSSKKNKKIIIYGFLSLWFLFMLLIFRSLTGVIVFIITMSGVGIYYINEKKSRLNLYVGSGFFIMGSVIILILSAFTFKAVKKFTNVPHLETIDLESNTLRGNKYVHDTSSRAIENGHYVWIHVAPKELRASWNKRSEIDYDSLDQKGQKIKYTLIRYLTSKGLKKDAEGVSQLTKKDIQSIEEGWANYIYDEELNIYTRIYQSVWEIYHYFHGGNPTQHSVAQRFESHKAGAMIFKENMLIGCGTGDLKNEFHLTYEEMNTKLESYRWIRAHNQYFTFYITFGIFGGTWALFSMFFPLYKKRKKIDMVSLAFLLIVFVSMINEDTLETQAGATFFAYFYSVFVFGREEIQNT
jgi:hypothetical protein